MINRVMTAVAAAMLCTLNIGLAADSPSTLDFPVGNHLWLGVRSGELDQASKDQTVLYDDIISVRGAAWMRLHFGDDTRLGKNSFIRVTSLTDGEIQVLDSATYRQWRGTTAYFNGGSLRVELVAGGLTHNKLSIDTASYDLVHDTHRGDGCGICDADDRVPSSDNRFARLFPTGCSATMYNEDSCFVTAGHCLNSGDVLQFNVPNSNSDCSTNQPPVADQFPITGLDGVNGGVGNDYGAVKAGTNNEGQTPHERYGAFVSIGNVPGSGDLTVNGYGVDDECTRSQIQQFCDGPMIGTDSETIYYNLDVTYGNSGSSILYNGEIIGVVTHCSYSCENYGTRIDKAAFVSVRENVCAGGGGGPCAPGEIEDCNGNCCPADWVGDGYCDDGTYDWNGVPIYLNCAEFNCDGGDCDCGSDPTGGCCIGIDCNVTTQADCAAAGGNYLGDDTDCANEPCDSGGCPAGEIEDCNGNCCPADWVGDGFCDDGTYDWNGVPIYLNCAEFNCDGGDCDCGSDPTGGCCTGNDCNVTTQADCAAAGGNYLGDDTDCANDPCGGNGGDGDTCQSAIMAMEGGNAFDTTNSTDSGFGEPDATQCEGTFLDWESSPDFWFVWTPSSDGVANFSTCDSASYDTSMVIYQGAGCNALTQVACNGDYADSTGCQEYHSQIDELPVTGGQSYYVRLGGWQAATGTGTLTIESDLGSDPLGACCTFEPCEQVTESECNASGGNWLGANIPCSECEFGACCYVDGNTDACMDTSEIYCSTLSGNWAGSGTSCQIDDPCGLNSDPLGACCYYDGNTGEDACIDSTDNECDALEGGDWRGPGTSCQVDDPCGLNGGNPCGPGGTPGSCCLSSPDSADCCDFSQETCHDYGGTWYENINDCQQNCHKHRLSWNVIGVDLTSENAPHYVVDVYLEMPDGWRLDAVAGNGDQAKMVATTSSFYQNSFGGPTTLSVSPDFYEIEPDLEWDSRVGIGAIDSSGNPHDENALLEIGIDWSEFEDEGGAIWSDNGLWFIFPDDPAGQQTPFTNQNCEEVNGTWVARLTSIGLDSQIMFEALFQGRDQDGNIWQESLTGDMISYNGEVDCNMNQISDACDIANGTSDDADGNGIPDECDSTCVGDVNMDGVTNVDDVLTIINEFGTTYTVDDLLETIGDFGCEA